uniref:Uncharacterized protein n=1 Tax=Tetranychus urticae TaxID=32264 RepID=T1KR27_TETUR
MARRSKDNDLTKWAARKAIKRPTPRPFNLYALQIALRLELNTNLESQLVMYKL